jgi:threonyl-tRNA synthetase
MRNVRGKEETAFTVQYDFVMPKRFHLVYTDNTGVEKEPLVVHRSSIGAIERVIAFLIEKYAGAFPLWLSPTQVKVLPIGEAHQPYAAEIYQLLKEHGIRAELDDNNETLGKKIRNWKLEKVPYALVIGDEEVRSQKLKVESRGGEKLEPLTTEKLLEKLHKEITGKK